MTARNFDAIASLFDLVEPMLTEFDDYRINGALAAAKRQHAAVMCMEDLIEKDAADRAADPVKAALLDCMGALSMCADQIHQMRGMFDDADGAIQDALDAAEDAEKKAREAIG